MINVNFATISLCICTFGLVWFSIFMSNEVKNKDKYSAFEEDMCNITNIIIPTIYPNTTNYTGWLECSCRSSCNRHKCEPIHKSYASCIEFYSDISPNILIQEQFGANELCTFNLGCVCPPTENGYLISLIKARKTYDAYINSLELCYHDSPITDIYLNDNYDISNLIALIVVLMIIIMIIGFLTCVLKATLDRRRTNERYYFTVFWNNCCLECRYAINECRTVCINMCAGCYRVLCCITYPETNDENNMEETSTRIGASGRHRSVSSRNYSTFQNPYDNGELEYLVDMDSKSSNDTEINN